MHHTEALPLIIAGPILRHCDQQNFTLWFVSREPMTQISLQLKHQDKPFSRPLEPNEIHEVPLGDNAFQYLIRVTEPTLLPQEQWVEYQVYDTQLGSLFDTVEGLSYTENTHPRFALKSNIDQLLHGSCRNPHHHSGDAMVAADTKIAQSDLLSERPALLMLTGDQVYVDDVAGPMLYAIHHVIEILGLPQEDFHGANINNSVQLDDTAHGYYSRHKTVLPRTQYQAKTPFWRWYINHPIFTSSIAENHLISLGEVIALYLLTWSPELWKQIDIPHELEGLNDVQQRRWQNEWQNLLEFKSGLTQVRRLLAHLPTYMIFDDHDVTDDWNLTAKWEMAAYGHDFSKRIIGNALIGYSLFQGLGNAPRQFDPVIRPLIDNFFASRGNQQLKIQQQNAQHQDVLIDALLKFEHWHYTLNTSPKIVVLDTRTRRWRSESNLAKPSGLLDWEALMDLQHALIDQEKVIIVSPAPMFGVKVIEAIQRTATFLGGSLLVDAENWMAHPGSANTLLSIFTHKQTPQEFIILSGDVHYSFAYDIHLRFRHGGPNIYQICCSGIKNQFPERLLPIFDKLNGWLYGHFSPLNLLTKRKRLSVRGRRPNGQRSQRLVNKSGLGRLKLNSDGQPSEVAVLHADMTETLFQVPRKNIKD